VVTVPKKHHAQVSGLKSCSVSGELDPTDLRLTCGEKCHPPLCVLAAYDVLVMLN